MKLNVYILLSGGMDSAAIVDFFFRNDYNIKCLFVDYGQLSNERELIAVQQITSYYGVSYTKLEVKNLPDFKEGFIMGRNLLLASLALMTCPFDKGTISMGIHSGTDYSDCTPSFVNKIQELLDLYAKERYNFRMPLINWNKFDIWKYCELNAVPVNLTYSCELGKDQPCGKCISCNDIIKIDACKSK